uniref:B-cell differentiation antigen CD72 n=1 Tax=Anas platyrhynchos TaxID=8839 RepID=A0A8B9SU55_ANAPL
MDEADSPYENVAPGPAPVRPAGERTRHSPGRCSRRRCVPAGLLAASLLLLVALVALGTCYWQATRELRDTSLEQAAERGRFSQEARAWEQSLEQARRELAQARAELQRAWREGNSSLLQLGRQEAELARVSGALAGAERELQDVQGRLEAGERAASSLAVPPSPDCCPPGWLLYHGKCLFVSSEKKSWRLSQDDCEGRASRLLLHDERQGWALPPFLLKGSTKYWVKPRTKNAARTEESFGWVSGASCPSAPHPAGPAQGLMLGQGLLWPAWGWQRAGDTVAHATLSPLTCSFPSRYTWLRECALMGSGIVDLTYCYGFYHWVCEQPPKLSNLSEMLSPLLARG